MILYIYATYNKFELKTDEYLTVMWSTFHPYETKVLIEVDVKVARLTVNIIRMLKCP